MKKITYTIIIPLFVIVVGELIVAKTQNIDIWQFITSKSIVIFDIIKNIIFFQIPIWSILSLGLFFLFIKKFITHRKDDFQLSKNHMDVYDKLSKNEQEVLKAIIIVHEIKRECSFDDIFEIIKKFNLTRLEITQVTTSLVDKKILSDIAILGSYDLSSYGKDIGVAWIQHSKEVKNNQLHKDNNDL